MCFLEFFFNWDSVEMCLSIKNGFLLKCGILLIGYQAEFAGFCEFLKTKNKKKTSYKP